MSEEQVVIEQPVVLEEKRYEYQPTDDENRPIGGRQVIKYHTEEELRDKLRDQNVSLIRKLRQETKKVRLGIIENDELPENVQKLDDLDDTPPQELTDEERYELARKLQDPVTAFEAVTTIAERQVKPELRALKQENWSLRAKLESRIFVEANPDYYKCQENFEAITSWMVRYNLAPIASNFQLAYDTLKRQDNALILGAAEVTPVVAPAIPAVEPIVETQPAQQSQQVVVPVSTGLNNDNSSSQGQSLPIGSEITYDIVKDGKKVTLIGLKAIAAMPSEEYKRRIYADKNFGKTVDKLEAESRKPKV